MQGLDLHVPKRVEELTPVQRREVLNSLMDDFSRSIDQTIGLKKLTIDGFEDDVNTLAEWPLSQLLIKSPDLEELTISTLLTTPANCSQLVEFMGNVAVNSSCLHKLHI